MIKNSHPISFIQEEKNQRDALSELLRQGALKMLRCAVEAEVASYIEEHSTNIDENGHRLVVRNGYSQERTLNTEVGQIHLKQPRINDKRSGKQFNSGIIPKYARCSPTIEKLIPVLYLKGISTNHFKDALEPILGEKALGLSPQVISRFLKQWEVEYDTWNKRDLSDKEYVYFWADGIYTNVRLDDDRVCTLVIMGTRYDGTKEIISVYDGYRESTLSWKDVLKDLIRRGLKKGPELAIGDGALGFWSAITEIYPETKHQRCWVHKIANVLDKMPKKVQVKAKTHLHQIYLAETKTDAEEAYTYFLELYEDKYPRACNCLKKNKEQLFTFFDFPAKHWLHIRTSNPIESTFATVRLRTKSTKGRGTRKATVTMIWKMALEAQKKWRKIRGYKLIPKLIKGVKFIDGIEQAA